MQEPNEKEIGSFGNDLLVDAVRMKLRWYQGTRLTESRPCPECGEENYRKHDFEDRIFAILITEDGFYIVELTSQGSFDEPGDWTVKVSDHCGFPRWDGPTEDAFEQATWQFEGSLSSALGELVTEPA